MHYNASSGRTDGAGGLLPGLGVTRAMESSRGRAAASRGPAPQAVLASVRVWGRTPTCWGFALMAMHKGKQPRGLSVLGNATGIKIEVCGYEHFTALEIKQQF